MFLLQQIFKFIRLLHTETATYQLSLGFVFGMFLGMTPVTTLHWILLFLFPILFRINLGATGLSFALFKVLALMLDPLIDPVGLKMLYNESLRGLWVSLYQAPVFPYTYFYNSIVIGSFLFAIILALPLYFISQQLVKAYRVTVVARFQGTYFWRALSTTKAYRLYVKFNELKN